MPLFHKKPFSLQPIPKDLKPEEEVFVCKATQEIFRDYESFFNRTFLCSTHAWTCSLTGVSGLTYMQALESEREARKLVDGLGDCYKQASLELIHHAPRTNMKTLADEICLYYRDRFVVGEVVDMTIITSSGAKIVKSVQIVRVILPASPSPSRAPSPSKVPVITTSGGQQFRFTSPQPKTKPVLSSPIAKSPSSEKLTNGLSSPPPITNGGEENVVNKSPSSGGKPFSDTRMKSPQPTSKVPISSNARFEPSHYRYFVEEVLYPEEKHTLKPLFLSRSKGVFTPKKLRVFLRCSTYRTSEKQPFIIKDEFVKKYNLGPSSINFAVFAVTPKSGRKRSLSQSKLENFSTPNGATSDSLLCAGGTLSIAPVTKKRRSSGKKKSSTVAKRGRKSGTSAAKTPKGSSAKKPKKVKRERKSSKSFGSPTTPKSPLASNTLYSSAVTPGAAPLTKSPRSKTSALKVLNKAKKFKQMDLKKNVVRKKDLSPEELAALKEVKERERKKKAEEEKKKREEEKMRREEERKRREEEKRERKEEVRKEREEERRRVREERIKMKMLELEWLKPREDLSCEDSLPLPKAPAVKTTLPLSLFGDGLMVVEFMSVFGPLFNLKEVVRNDVTFEMIEYAVCSQEMDSQLFEIIKFLLQAIFATMEEEYEDKMVKINDKKSVTFIDGMGNGKECSPTGSDEEGNGGGRSSSQSPPTTDVAKAAPEEDSKKAEENDVEMETGGIEEEEEDEREDEEEESKPLDVRLENIKAASVNYSQWSAITQKIPLHKLVIDAYTITEVLRLHFLSCGAFRETPNRRYNRVNRRGGFTDADDPIMELLLTHPEISTELLVRPVFSLSPEHKMAILSALCAQLLTFGTTREFVYESHLEMRKAAIDAHKLWKSEVHRKKEEMRACQKWKKEVRDLKKQKDMEKKLEKASGKVGTENGSASTEGNMDNNPAKPLDSKGELSSNGSSEVVAAADEQKAEEASLLEAAPPPMMTKEEEESHLKKLEEQISLLRKESHKSSAGVRMQPVGEDRYWRKYWIFNSLSGLFVEDYGIHQTLEEVDSDEKAPVPDFHSTPVEESECRRDLPDSSNVDSVGAASSPTKAKLGSECTSNPPAYSQVCSGAVLQTDALAASAGQLQDNSEHGPPTVHSSSTSSNADSVPSSIPSLIPLTASAAATAETPPVYSGDVSTDDGAGVTPESAATLSTASSSEVLQPQLSATTWQCYSCKEDIESLIQSLNPRGIRENELRQNLLQHLQDEHLFISKCIFQREREFPSLVPKYNSTEEFFELYLREQILDIEEKIHLGNLGYIRNRDEWRTSIENSGAAAAIGNEKLRRGGDSLPSNGEADAEQQPASEDGCGGRAHSSVRELACALLQVQDGIGKKFLMPPLGSAKDQKKKKDKNVEVKESDLCLERWRKSLGEVSSFSQIFLHLATLERAVMWSKSLMKVRCRICRRKCGEEFMLLCDGCDHGYHTYCLKPPLEEVPEGDWFCYDCVPATPIKPRRRQQRLVIVEEEVEEEEEEAEEEEEEVEEDENDSDLEEVESDDEDCEDEEDDIDMEEEVVERVPLRTLQRRGSRQKTPPIVRGKTRAAAKKKLRGRGNLVQSKVGKRKRSAMRDKASIPPAKRGRGRKMVGKHAGKDWKKHSKSIRPQDLPLRSKKKLQLDSPVSSSTRSPITASAKAAVSALSSKTESIIASIIELRTSQGGRRPTGSTKRELRGLETQLCQALWDEMNQHRDSWHFATPVKKKEYPDYFDVVTMPMDLSTVRSRIKRGGYSTIDEFLRDMLLIFSNTTKYKKLNQNAKKAGAVLKKHFEKRCNDLGLKDLQLSEMDFPGPDGKTTGTRQSSRLRRR